MDRSERFHRIDRMLNTGTTTFAALQEALGISRAQLKRDLAYLRERFNAPIEYDRDVGGYRFGKPQAGPRYELPGLWFSAEEAHALLTMHQLLKGLDGEILGPHFEPLLQRLRAILGSGDHDWQEVENRIRVIPIDRREAKAGHFGLAAGALLRRKRLHIRHYNRAEDRETEREVSPQRLVHYRDNWYLDAWCHLRDDLRSFAVDAIREAQMLEARAKEVAKAELDEYLAAGYGIFAGRKLSWATLKFTPVAARWVAAQRWHPQQRARVEKDGSYVLELPYADDRELVMDILRFGPEAEVLAPAALRKRVAEQLRAAAKRYG
ncbi:MAG: helix-turn-helix transcriptional regulator [Betaproteobacteria bacterium]